MTTPDLSGLIPTKWKPWVAALGTILSYIIPTVSASVVGLSQPWPTVFAAVLTVLAWFGVYGVPYAPKGTQAVFVPEDAKTVTVQDHNDHVTVNLDTGAVGSIPTGRRRVNPWKRT